MDLKVNEIFASFQGEGIHTGIPTTFIRLAGCNLRCIWCDTMYAIEASSGSPMDISSVIAQVREIGLERVCLTGGEPLVQPGSLELVKSLISEGAKVDLETNGSLDIRPFIELGDSFFISLDAKLPSSGMDGEMFPGNIEILRPSDQLKFVAADLNDMEHAFTILRGRSPDCPVIFTPVSNTGGEAIAEILLSGILSGQVSGDIRLMLQTHKMIWGKDRRGV